jgi:hypothetical protein
LYTIKLTFTLSFQSGLPGLTRSVRVRSEEDKVTLAQVFLPAVEFLSVRIIPPMADIHIHLKNVLMKDRSGGNLGTFKLSNVLVGYRGPMERNYFHIFCHL